MARLGDVFLHIRNGANIKQGLDDTGYPITRIETISNRVVNREKMGYAGITDVNKYSDFVLQDGDILMSHINSEIHLGKVALYEKEDEEIIIHGMNLLSLRPNKDLITSKYAFYYLSSLSFLRQIPNITKKSVNQASFTVSALKELAFPLTSIEEQKKITLDLDKVNGLISLRKQQLAKLDELVKSRFIELFIGKGYPVTSIKELLVQNSTVEKINNTKIEKFVTVGIKGKGAREREIKDGKWPVPFSGYRVKEGQFIYSRIDARNGAFAILPKEVDGSVVSKDFPVFEIKADKMLPNVLLFSVLQDDFVRQIQNSSFGATNRQRIQEEVFGEYTITLPPMEIQNQFTAFVEQTDKSKFQIQQSLEKLETLKKALMQKYFG